MDFSKDQKRFLATAYAATRGTDSDLVDFENVAARVGMEVPAAYSLYKLLAEHNLAYIGEKGPRFSPDGKQLARRMYDELSQWEGECAHGLLTGLYKASGGSIHTQVDLVPIGEKLGMTADEVERVASKYARLSKPSFHHKINDYYDKAHHFTCITDDGIARAKNVIPPEKTKAVKRKEWWLERYTKLVDNLLSKAALAAIVSIATALGVGSWAYEAGKNSVIKPTSPATTQTTPQGQQWN